MGERISFNINAELHENSHGDLAIKFPGPAVYSEVGTEPEARFQKDGIEMLEFRHHPASWSKITARELENRDWHCIAMLGFLEGDAKRPAVELEVDPKEMGKRAKDYLADAIGAG